MGWLLLLGLLVLPWVEFWLLMKLPWPLWLTVVEILITAGIGWWFNRSEDLSLWSEMVSDFQNGRVPTMEGLDAMVVLLGAWALLLPGLLSDALGALLVLPRFREVFLPGLRALLLSRRETWR